MFSLFVTSAIAIDILRPAHYEPGFTQMIDDVVSVADAGFLKLFKKKDILMAPIYMYTTTTTTTDTGNPVNNEAIYCHQNNGRTYINETMFPNDVIEYSLTVYDQANVYQSCANKITGPHSRVFPVDTAMVVRNGRCFAHVYPNAIMNVACADAAIDVNYPEDEVYCFPMWAVESYCPAPVSLPVFQAQAD
eukprot:GHVH01016358.1.p1 GENE.GHVH01016358.1~~GHVH01016358.1.p1  ORF type:complete len:191 (+),score=10.65 GHVH01016358.1:56-628(+)